MNATLATCMILATSMAAQDPSHRATRPSTASASTTVTSKDGTPIAYTRSGKGPALILVASALARRADAARLATLLAPTFTVLNYDRRGRGDSGDAGTYAVAREIEDIDALVGVAGGSAALFGSSSGAMLALEAANQLGARITGLVLFEPPCIVDASRAPIPDAFVQRVTAHLAAGRRVAVVREFMQECVGVPEEMLGMLQKSPMWPGMEQVAHTLPYDLTIMAGLMSGKPLPPERWTKLTAPTLVIDGERSDAYLRQAVQALCAVLPQAQRQTLAGQDHSAVFVAPQALVPLVTGFLVKAGKG